MISFVLYSVPNVAVIFFKSIAFIAERPKFIHLIVLFRPLQFVKVVSKTRQKYTSSTETRLAGFQLLWHIILKEIYSFFARGRLHS